MYRKSSGSNAGSSLTLESAAFGGGRLTPDGALLYVTDYLGSVRAVVDGKTGELYKASDYSASQRKLLMENNGYKTETIFYDPTDSRWLPGSPTYIGPKR